MKRETVRPGQSVERSGIYVDPKSGETSTLVRGKTAPPTPELPVGERADSHPDGPTHTGGGRRKG
jgi:hypothetical protein